MTTMTAPVDTEFADLPCADPASLGMDAKHLERVDARMAQAVERGEVPGVVTVVLRHGHVAHVSAHGHLDSERRNALPIDALFRMYSQTKPVTAALTMQLQEEGVFYVDEPITKWLPEFEGREVLSLLDPPNKVRGQGLLMGQTVPMQRQITIRDLLTMTSGLPSFGNIPSAMFPLLEPAWSGTEFGITNPGVVDTSVSAEQRVLQMAQLPNARQPGAAWEYAADFDVLTQVLERATGQNLDQLFQERIFGPLGVEGCGFYCPPEDADRLVTNHHWSEDGALNPVERPEDSHKVRESLGQQISGNGLYGGVLMTPAAYTRFATMLLNGGELDGQRVLGRKTIELMTADHLQALTGEQINLVGPGYGFGFGYSVRREIAGTAIPGSIGTYGWGGAAGTYFIVDPTENLAALFFTHVFMYQFNPAAYLETDFEKGVYEALV